MMRYALIGLASVAFTVPGSALSVPTAGAAGASIHPSPVPPVKAKQIRSAAGARASTTKQSLPADILAFRDRREQCEHFMGEDGYDKARAAFLNRKVKQFCTGTDKQLASLRKRYAKRRDIVASLRQYEDEIE